MTLTELSRIEFTTQSGISRALARLDEEVGTPVLQRAGRRLRLTQAGTAFKQHVDAAIHSLDDGLAAIEQLLDPGSGTVTVAFQPSLGSWLVPDLVRTFRIDHPGVTFELIPKRDEMVSAFGHLATVELEFSTRQPPEPDLAWRHLVDEPLLLAVDAGHTLAGRTQVDLADCAQLPFVMIGESSELRSASHHLLERAGVDPDVAFVCDDLPTMRAFVSAGLGVAIMPRPHGIEATAGRLRYLPINDPHARREVGVSWSRRRRMLPATELFRDHVLTRRRADELAPGG